MVRLILGRAGTGKTGMIIDEIRSRVLSREGRSLLIVPEQYSHEAERELAKRCGDGASLSAEVLSFTRLAHRVALEVGGSARTYVDAGGRLLQLALALEQTGASLQVYGAALRQPQLMAQLLTALDELRRGRAGEAALREAGAAAGGQLEKKLSDLLLLRAAMDAMESRSGADPASRLEVLAGQIPRCAFLRGSRVYVDGFTDFTAQERAVLRALWQVCDVTVCLSCDSLAGESEVFSLSRRTARLLRQEAEEDGAETAVQVVPSRKAGTPLGALEENLFGWTEEVFPHGNAIRLATAPGPAAECELAAAEILRLVRETGCRWRDIAVAVRGFEEYRPLLEETFRHYGVPLYASTRTDVQTHPLPALMGAVFDLLSDGWSYESMFTYLKTGLAPISRADCDILENYVLTWSLRGTAWTREQPWRQHPDGFGGKFEGDVPARLAHIDDLRRQVAAPLEHFRLAGAEAGDALGQCRAVAAFWDEIGLPERLDRRAEELDALGEARSAAEYRQLWELMVSALEQCAAVLGAMPMDQEAFGRLFRRMLSQYDVGTIPVALDRVTAGDFDRMRRRQLKHLLILGASDDRLPRAGDGGGIFTDPERDALRQLGVELPDSDDVLDREFNLIYNVLSLPGETLYMSRSLFTAQGGETRPCFVTDRVKKLFGLAEVPGDLTSARLSAPGPALELAARGSEAAMGWFAGDADAAARLERLRQAAGITRDRLDRESVRALYGDRLWLTATRIDNFASCKFQYFLRYGLKARPRQAAAFAPPELGTFLHYLLENVAREVTARGGFARVEDSVVVDLTDRYVEAFVHEKLEDFREKSPRFVYLFRRLTETARRIVMDTANELKRSDFRPLDFELNFSEQEGMPPVRLGEGDDALTLTGVADRVDGWEHGGRLYLRVVDYKSGPKSFSLTDVWYGMGLQMLLYLFSLEKNGRERYGKEIVPAGVLYVPARDVLLSAKERLSEEEILAEKAKSLRRSGLLLSDEGVLNAMEHGPERRYLPAFFNRDDKLVGDSLATAEQLSLLSRHVDDVLRRMARELHGGDITADPWFKNEKAETCIYCDYYDACHFDENAGQTRYKVGLKAPEFWARLDRTEQEGASGHGAD